MPFLMARFPYQCPVKPDRTSRLPKSAHRFGCSARSHSFPQKRAGIDVYKRQVLVLRLVAPDSQFRQSFAVEEFGRKNSGGGETEKQIYRFNKGDADHGRAYFAIGFPNIAGGYEMRSPYYKGCIAPKDIGRFFPVWSLMPPCKGGFCSWG